MDRRLLASAVVSGLVVTALFWIDPLFVPLVLLGPLIVGAVSAWRGLPLRWVVVLWLVAGIGAVISDFLVNREDVVFHLVLTVFLVAVASGAWWVTNRLLRSRRKGSTP